MGWFFVWLALSIGVGALAQSRGRFGVGYFFLAMLISPLLGFIVVLVINDLAAEAKKERLRHEDHERQLESLKVLATGPGRASQSEGANKSLADELAKLAELRDKGVLTEVEFQNQKAKLLA